MNKKITSAVVALLGVIILLVTWVVSSYIFNHVKSSALSSTNIVEDNSSIKKNIFKREKTSIFTTKCNNSALVEIAVIPSESEDYISSFSNTTIKRTLNEALDVPLEDYISLSEEPLKNLIQDRKNLPPRLAIIMDDMGFLHQVKDLKKIKYPITPAFFPPSCRYPNTPSLARKFSHYMVHLPMEALQYSSPEYNTLLVSDDADILEQKISEVIRDFPKAIAINNHTGSKFTSDSEAMNRLFPILITYNIHFIDSRTSAKTKAVKVGENYNLKVLQRNIFLDNKADVSYIQKQLKKAVLYAKKHGEAIAICHPRDATFKALKKSQDILRGINLVYINEFYNK